MTISDYDLWGNDCAVEMTLVHPIVQLIILSSLKGIPQIVRATLVVDANANVKWILVSISVGSIIVYEDI